MLYELYRQLHEAHSGLNVFRYESVRAAAAFVVAFVVCVLAGGPMIAALRRLKIREAIKSDSKEVAALHASKAGTPTMGGLIILSALLVAMVVCGRADSLQLALAVGTTLALGAVGVLDDWVKLTKTKLLGLSPGHKITYILIIAVASSVLLWLSYGGTDAAEEVLSITMPVWKEMRVPLTALGGALFVAWTVVVITGASNAVNLTDGLDGLAAGCTAIAVAAFGVVAFVVGNPGESAHLLLVHVPETAELAVFSAGLAGALLGFLWFNCFPAQVFMGDTGSLAIGGAIGFVAVAIRQEILLVLVGGIFVIEALSVIVQTGWFKFTRLRYGEGRRVLLCAPLHHHYQRKGTPETKISIRMCIVSLLCAVTGVAITLKVR